MWLLTPSQSASPDAAAAQEAALRAFGVSQAEIEGQRRQPNEDVPELVEVWAWHLPAMELFDAMRTQWHAVAGLGGLVFLGLDYAALPVVQQQLGQQPDRELFQQLQTMERGALSYLNRPTTP